MITEISIRNEATFSPSSSVSLGPLKKINFIYGSNGSGKTTISRIAAKPDDYSACSVKWLNNLPLRVLTYNRDFLAAEFDDNASLKGVFTLGSQNIEIIRKIEDLRAKQEDEKQKRLRLRATLDGKDDEPGAIAKLKALEDAFIDTCWQQKVNHDDSFKLAFKGLRNNKVAFRDRVLSEHTNNKIQPRPLVELITEAEVLLAEPSALEASYELISSKFTPDQLQLSLLSKPIVGRQDVHLSPLITRLNNSDWIQQGIPYLSSANGQCPFCQQIVSEALVAEIEGYFDDSFTSDLLVLREFLNKYAAEQERVAEHLDKIATTPNRWLDLPAFTKAANQLKATLSNNLNAVNLKLSEPSRVFQLSPIDGEVFGCNAILALANEAIQTHNELISDFAARRSQLISEIWSYIVFSELGQSISAFLTEKGSLEKTIEKIEEKLELIKQTLQDLDREIAQLEREIVSIEPTVTAINNILTLFGFTAFKLAQAGDGISYDILREDGTKAKQTLSEGEKTFLTFLYFFHLIQGSHQTSGLTDERVVVIDDPISSLDSQILFIVGSLIKKLIADCDSGTGYIRQVIVLTHNVYFHKEVTYAGNRSKSAAFDHETFWIVRKIDRVSTVEGYSSNPIKTSYDLLWNDVREPVTAKHTIQNSLRRILENYFRILGNKDFDKICNMFEGQDRVLCGSLISWAHDGSHYALDDLYVAIDEAMVENYLRVFREIFVKLDNLGHYNMMMGIDIVAT